MILFRTAICWLTLRQMILMWLSNFNLLSTVTPRSSTSPTRGMLVPSHLKTGSRDVFPLPKLYTYHDSFSFHFPHTIYHFSSYHLSWHADVLFWLFFPLFCFFNLSCFRLQSTLKYRMLPSCRFFLHDILKLKIVNCKWYFLSLHLMYIYIFYIVFM